MSRVLALVALLPLTASLVGCDGASWIVDDPPGPPDPPLLAELDSPTREARVVVNGTKMAGTSVRFGEGDSAEEIVALNAATRFQHEVPLTTGQNTLTYTVLDSLGRISEPASLTVELDDVAPPAPVLDPVPPFTGEATVTLSGTREPFAEIWLNGRRVEEATASSAFTFDVDLLPGVNTLRLSAVDEVGNESGLVTATITRTNGEFFLDADGVPTTVPHGTASVTVSGTRSAGVAIELDDSEVLPPAAQAGAWSIEAPIATPTVDASTTMFTVSGVLGDERWSTTFTVTVDATIPSTPLIDALPVLITSQALTLTGEMPDAADLVINGEVVIDDAPAGPFSVDLTLPWGLTELTIRARDDAGNASPSVTPKPRVYANPSGVVLLVDEPPAFTLTSPLNITGVRGLDVAIYVNDVLYSMVGVEPTFSVMVPLVEGPNTLVVEGRAGDAVTSTTLDVTLAPPGPGAPVLDETRISTTEATVDVTGSRAPNTAVLRNGVAAVPAQALSTFTDTVSVPLGTAVLSYALRDIYGRTGPSVDVTITYAPPVDGGVPDGGVLDGGLIDGGAVADGGAPDAGAPDAGLTDGGLDAG